jgi:hypothetical protein
MALPPKLSDDADLPTMSEIRYRRHADLRITSLEGEGVVLHLGDRRYFSVNETGLTLLEATTEARTFDELVQSILNEYDVPTEEAVATTRKFLDECLASNVILQVAG